MPTTTKAQMSHTLTKHQREELAGVLRTKRDELQRRLAAAPNEHVLEHESDIMDAATDVTAEADAAGISENETRLLREIEAALARVTAGTYGLSEESRAPIPYARLRAVPWARRTAEEEEQREARNR